MAQYERQPFLRFLLIFIQLIFVFSISLAKEFRTISQAELKARFGQAGTWFNDGRSCYRTCDGKPKTCYYEMHAQMYDTMSARCGECARGTLSDCFNEGCVPGNGIERVIMSVNQKLPGQAINCCKNDRIIVDVTNHMAGQGLAMHWHGVLQKDSPWFDGVPMVTQCPIAEENTFRYVFNASEAGTHVYHAHSGVHRSNGLVGKFTVYEHNDPHAALYDYDLSEHSILLIDWDNKLAEDMGPNVRSATNLPESILIDGFGFYVNIRAGRSNFAPMAVFYVEKGKRHRFRFANAGSHVCPFEISIGGHYLNVIATDGNPVEPVQFESIVSSPGERFDVVLTARRDLGQTFLTIRAVGACASERLQAWARIIFVDSFANYRRKIEDHQPLRQIPTYDSMSYSKTMLGHPSIDCTKNKNSCIASLKSKADLNEENLRLVKPAKVIPIEFRELAVSKIRYNYLNIQEEASVFLLNNIANLPASVPGLIQDDSDVSYCNGEKLTESCEKALDGTLLCYCPHLIDLNLGEVYEIVVIDGDDKRFPSHPMHLHGHKFQVIDMGTMSQFRSWSSAYGKDTHLPVIKDTVTVPRDGFVRFRFRASNPGYWIFHCHFDYHLTPGMAMVLRVGKREEMLTPPKNFSTCGNHLMPVFDDFH